MSLNNNFETLLRVSKTRSPDSLSNKNEIGSSESTATELIARVINDIRVVSLSSKTQSALQEIQRLNSAQRNLLLVSFGSSLRKMEHFADAASILNALTAEIGAE